MSDRYANPFTAPRVHHITRTEIDHPKFGKHQRTFLACGRKWSHTLKTSTDKKKATCLHCLIHLGLVKR